MQGVLRRLGPRVHEPEGGHAREEEAAEEKERQRRDGALGAVRQVHGMGAPGLRHVQRQAAQN